MSLACILTELRDSGHMMTSSNGSIFPVTGPLCGGIHRSTVNSLHKGQWRGALMFSLICTWIDGWANNREAGDLRHHNTHYDVTVMWNRHNDTLQWRHKGRDSVSRLFTQSFIQTQIKENIKAPSHWPLCGEFTGDWWIPRTNGQLRGKCFHLMTYHGTWRI